MPGEDAKAAMYVRFGQASHLQAIAAHHGFGVRDADRHPQADRHHGERRRHEGHGRIRMQVEIAYHLVQVAREFLRELPLQGDEGKFRQAPPRHHLLRCQRMSRREDDVKGLCEQRFGLDFSGDITFRSDAQIGFTREHAGRDRFHAAVDQMDRHVREFAHETGQHFRQQGCRHQLRCGDAHDAAFERLERGHFVQYFIQVGQNLFHQRIEFASDLGELYSPRVAIEELHAQGVLQLLDRAAQGRLGRVQMLGGDGETAEPRDREKSAQLAQSDIHRPIRWIDREKPLEL